MKLTAGPRGLLLQAVSGDLEPGPGGARLLLTALLARPSTSHQGHRPCLVFSAPAHVSTPVTWPLPGTIPSLLPSVHVGLLPQGT